MYRLSKKKNLPPLKILQRKRPAEPIKHLLIKNLFTIQVSA